MSISTIRRKLKEQLIQVKKSAWRNNLHRLYHMDIGAYNYHYYTLEELEKLAADDDN